MNKVHGENDNITIILYNIYNNNILKLNLEAIITKMNRKLILEVGTHAAHSMQCAPTRIEICRHASVLWSLSGRTQ